MTVIPIILLLERGFWTERTFYDLEEATGYFKCFTLLLKEQFPTVEKNCGSQVFIFNFKAISKLEPPKGRRILVVVLYMRKTVFFFNLFTGK